MEPAVPAPLPLRPGARVVVRYRLAPGSTPSMTDVVGLVSTVDEASVTLTTSSGSVTLPRQVVVAVREIPPRQERPGRPHLTVGVADLGRMMADGWPAVESVGLGGWLLRASGGFTGRGNSVLPHGDPGLPLPAALDQVERWYAARDLAARFHLDLPREGAGPVGPAELAELGEQDVVRRLVAAHPVGAELLARGYRAVQPTLTLTGATSAVPPLRGDAPPVEVDATLTPHWLTTYARQRSILPGVTEQVLTGSAGQLFARAGAPGHLSAVARMSVHPGWAGIHAVWVDPHQRRQGLAVALMSALAALARDHAMASMYLQVEAGNAAARELYTGLGFTTHHAYVYLDPPT
ncbi:MAG: GNAT family N-acetyltransferase [Actinomycetota bacterium]|nr:GNAT family N-acetyltransferase [Actinomycetota bacterium]